MKKVLIGLVMALVLMGWTGSVWATALTDNRNTPGRSGNTVALYSATNVIIYAGAMVCVDTSGYAVPASDTASYAVVGRARKKSDTRLINTYTTVVEVDRGVYRWENADSIADSDIGAIVYVTDDATVNKTGGGNNVIAGAVVDVDDDGVWVDTGKIGSIGASTPSSLAVTAGATVGTTLAVTGASTLTGGATIAEDVAINLDATDEEVAIISTTGAAKLVRIYCTNANPTTTALLELDYNADGDADGSFLLCKDNASGDTKFSVAAEGNTTVAGTLSVTGLATLTGNAASDELDSRTATTLLIGKATATAVTVGASDINTKVSGTFQANAILTTNHTATTLTVDSSYFGKCIMFNTNAAIAVTLPANTSAAGSWFDVVVIGNDDCAPTISSTPADTLLTPGSADSDSVTWGTGHRIGASARFFCTGANWMVRNLGGTTMTYTDSD